MSDQIHEIYPTQPVPTIKVWKEVFRGQIGGNESARLFVSGDMSAENWDNLITLLTIQMEVLAVGEK